MSRQMTEKGCFTCDYQKVPPDEKPCIDCSVEQYAYYKPKEPDKPRKYDFEPEYSHSVEVIREQAVEGAIEALCRNCRHGLTSYHLSLRLRCLEGTCDTLECIIGRLSDLPLGDSNEQCKEG